MAALAPELWAVIAIIAGAAAIAMLHVLAASVRDAVRLRDLRAEAERLRAERLRQLRTVPDEEVEIVGEGPAGAVPHPASMKLAA